MHFFKESKAAVRQFFPVLACCLFFVLPAFAQESAPRISGFSFDGLKRTKEFVIQRDLKRFLGMEISESVLHDIETVLQSENLFTDISLECVPVSQTETDIRISLKEKISILPVPLVAAGDGNICAGAFFLDSNAMGLKNTFALGALFSESILMGMTMFARPASGRIPGIALYAGVFKKDSEMTDASGRLFCSYASRSFQGRLQVSQRLTETVSAAFSSGCSLAAVDRDGKTSVCIESVKAWENSVSLSAKSSGWNGIFLSEKSASAEGCISVTSCGDSFASVHAGLRFQHPLTGRLRFVQHASGFCGFDLPAVFYRDGQSVSVRLFLDDFVTDRIAGISAGCEYAAAVTKIGLLSVYGTYQAAVARDLDGSAVFNQGAGGGLKLYLSKVAFPACALELIYNMTERKIRTGFSLGISF